MSSQPLDLMLRLGGEASDERLVPPVPLSLSDTGLSEEAVTDLLLKTLYVKGAVSGQEMADTLCLPFALLDDLLIDLQRRRLVEVRGTRGSNRVSYIFDLTIEGQVRAQSALSSNQYVGAAPVPLESYLEWIRRQSIRNVVLNRAQIEEGFQHLVINHDLFETLGPGINSAKSLFLYGDAGNGKTMLAEAIAQMLGGTLYLPYAVDLGGQIMVVHDPVYHHPVREDIFPEPTGTIWRSRESDYDRRFQRVRRPVVMVGGELTLEQLDLQYDVNTKIYQAPFQVKANGGVLVIDDFGRQRVPPRDLLNRWIFPLEKRTDFLTLHTGGKFPIPFDCLLVFATNLAPQELAEEAFLRRIQYKVHIPSPTPEQYREIFRRVCGVMNISYREEAVDYIYQRAYRGRGIPPRSCHPRDLLEHVRDAARFREVPVELTPELLDEAFRTYFITVSDLAAQAEGEEA